MRPTIGEQLATAWGLDPTKVRSIRIDLRGSPNVQAENWPLVTVEMWAEDELSILTVDCTLIQHEPSTER